MVDGMKKLFSLILASVMAAGLFPLTAAPCAQAADFGKGGLFSAPPANSIPISDRAELEDIQNNLGGTFHLTGDIDLSGAEWVPIGPFRGVFDGRGYAISNLEVPEGSNRRYAGLFGTVNGAIIRNVTVHIGAAGVTAVSPLTGSNSTSFAGGLAGEIRSRTEIVNCHTTGDVYAIGRDANAGGLVGDARSAAVSACSSAGNVSAVSERSSQAGGLIGYTASSVAVSNCYTAGNVSAVSERNCYAGGLFGRGSARILNSYASGDVSASGSSVRAGGLTGQRRATTSSYRLSTQTVTMTASSSSTLSVSGTPLTDSQMKTRASFVLWDFTKIWGIDPHVNGGYPFIREGEISAQDPEIDYSAGDIIIIGSDPAFSINLTRETITLPDTYTPAVFSINGGSKWRAVKPNTFENIRFVRLLNKDLTLHISNQPSDRASKKPPEDSVITFPRINKRPPTPKLAVNYLIAADNTGESPGDWVLSAKNGTAAVKDGIQVGVADEKQKYRALDHNGYGRFYDGGAVGIPVKELRNNKLFTTRYFIRIAPKDEGGAYTAASRPRRISVLSERKAPNYKMRNNGLVRVRAGTSMVTMNGIILFSSKGEANVNITGTIAFWTDATAKKPASAKQFFR
jgi:hypothetical protein